MYNAPFVSREEELTQLNELFQKTVSNDQKTLLIAGEAGTGKTALLNEFIRRMQSQNQNVLIAIGRCDAQTGTTDAYLPFREILAGLTGSAITSLDENHLQVENQSRLNKFLKTSGHVLWEYGPEVLDLFVPGANLAARVTSALAARTHWFQGNDNHGQQTLTQEQIQVQYTNLLQGLATKHPLLIIVDDLHWIDPSSAKLFFHLSQRLKDHPILLIGTFRPDHIPQTQRSQHPFAPILQEYHQQKQIPFINLDKIPDSRARLFVDDFLDSEPNQFDMTFRHGLWRQTKGHPLFTLELIRTLRNRGDIYQNTDGEWIANENLNWHQLPLRVDNLIDERLADIEPHLLEIITIASVQGDTFMAEVIANLEDTSPRRIVRYLSHDLHRRYQLVDFINTDYHQQQRISQYRFHHNLYHKHIYQHLDHAERVYLHEGIAYALIDIYGSNNPDMLVELAYHFTQAEVPDQAYYYAFAAGRQALEKYAYNEAIAYFSQALQFVDRDNHETRFDILLAREEAHGALGQRIQQRNDLDLLKEAATHHSKPEAKLEAKLRYANLYTITHDYDQAINTCQQILDTPNLPEDSLIAIQARLYLGDVYTEQSLKDKAKKELQIALDNAQKVDKIDLEAQALTKLSQIARSEGKLDEAQAYLIQADVHYQELGDQSGQVRVHVTLGQIHFARGRKIPAQQQFLTALNLSRQINNRRFELICLSNISLIALDLGHFDMAHQHIHSALKLSEEINDKRTQCILLDHLSLVHYYQKSYSDAHKNCRQSLSLSRELNLDSSQGYALHHLGMIQLAQNQYEMAYNAFLQAQSIRQRIHERAPYHDTSAYLAWLYYQKGEIPKAYQLINATWHYLRVYGIDNMEEPLRIYLICYHIFKAQGDKRTTDILAAAKLLRDHQANQIQHPLQRHMFLNNIPANYELNQILAQSPLRG
ncbi:MAG TPA: AAA family ATPase [Anaerolineae bacterium]|nr:AAA family ATPase [Anaerolineae bacterium]